MLLYDLFAHPNRWAFLLPEITMPKLIDRQIEQDEHGYYCIDTYAGIESFPFCGYGNTEHEAISMAEQLARLSFSKSEDRNELQ